jgi:RNA polymerase sigma-70 factor (ECF subfamily)
LDQNASAQRFREIVLPHLADALALARWLTGSPHDAEDVVQEACVKALVAIATYRGGNARAWVLTIVRNTAFTFMAKRKSSRLVVVGDLAELEERTGADAAALAEERPSPEAELIRRADAAAVEMAIAALPLPFREIVVLRDVNGLSYGEIAAMLQIPIGTVMSRLSRARATLIGAIGEKVR